MEKQFTLSEFTSLFPDDDSCLDEIRRLKYPNGTRCNKCKKNTKYYRIKDRPAYSCKFCRDQIYPLSGTIFEKTSTPLRTWFYALFLMMHTRADISIKQLQRELEVTYKTAWRMYNLIRPIMPDTILYDTVEKVHKWIFFNKIEIKVVQKQDAAEV